MGREYEVYRFGLMVRSMKENGRQIRQMVEASFGMWMEIIMKENGKMIERME